MSRELGTRVKVWSGDHTTYLGEGTLTGFATVYFVIGEDYRLTSAPNAEEKPEGIPEENIVVGKDNPKIKLDDGQIVYGCQVWWEPIKKRN